MQGGCLLVGGLSLVECQYSTKYILALPMYDGLILVISDVISCCKYFQLFSFCVSSLN